jgi:hypothetical protein
MRQPRSLLRLPVLALLAALAACIPAISSAVQVGKLSLPDQWTVDGEALALNGAGTRQYGFLKIDVYVAALYLRKPDRSEQSILSSTSPKVMHLRFLRDVSQKDTVRAWQVYFESNCQSPCVLPRESIAAFNALVPPSKEGDTQTYVVKPDSIEFSNNGRLLCTVRGAEFSKLLLSTWIGASPTTPELKKALLGL